MKNTLLLTENNKKQPSDHERQLSLFKDYYQFIYLILMSFVSGILFLVFIQYNSSRSMEKLIEGNGRLLKELKGSNRLREVGRDITAVESNIRGAIVTNDTTYLKNIPAKIAAANSFLDSLQAGSPDPMSKKLIARLKFLANQKLAMHNELIVLYHQDGKMANKAYLANPRANANSSEINTLIRNIYNGRKQRFVQLSSETEESGRKAKLSGAFLVALILVIAISLGWFIINRIKKQNQLILKLNISEKKIREAALIKENFMANMSHEIRTPLNSILGFTNLLLKSDLAKDSLQFTESIQRSGENLLSIVNDILDLAKIEAGMMSINIMPFSIRGLIQSIETFFSDQFTAKGLNFELKINDAVPDVLIGDPTRLTQILVNLIGNALKFTEKGTISLSVHGKQTDDEHLLLAFRIKDTGIGISAEKLPHIFDRFRQVEDSITRNYGGTGLGLSLVKDLIYLQEGEITVESEVGMGTGFIFFIPYLISSKQITHTEKAEVTDSQAPNYPLTILVADDNEMNQQLVKHLLEQWAFSFDIVSGGQEAITLLKKKAYDLVLMDIQMPGMDGYAVTNYIRNELRLSLPVIAMTAHAMAGEREKCLSSGMNEYLSKPLRENELLNMLCRFSPSGLVAEGSETVAKPPTFEHIDLEYMRGSSKGNFAYEKNVTALFIKLIPGSIQSLQRAHQEKDIIRLKAVAHDLKTTISIMGLTPVLEGLLDKIEEGDGNESTLPANIAYITEVCSKALSEAEMFLESLS